jgi:hypothetical protein
MLLIIFHILLFIFTIYQFLMRKYLCNKLGNMIFYGIFYRGDSRDQKHAVYGKNCISYFSTGVWKIN